MTNVRGRTWDSFIRKINETDTTFHIDTTWGKYFYFYYGSWYKVKVWDGWDEIVEKRQSFKFLKR